MFLVRVSRGADPRFRFLIDASRAKLKKRMAAAHRYLRNLSKDELSVHHFVAKLNRTVHPNVMNESRLVPFRIFGLVSARLVCVEAVVSSPEVLKLCGFVPIFLSSRLHDI